MFSSITSFFPSLHLPNSNTSVLSPTQSQFEPRDTPEEEEAYKDESVEEPVGEETNVKKGKTRSVNETFIIVRPPPAKSNHPLNLQVQLVPPAVRSTRQSVDESDGGNSTATSVSLTRTMSNRSDTSSYGGSTASFTSTGSVSSTRRTIIPLYSLQAHNVLTNTIVDAGTDAKVARFLRRGMELVDLAMLEPVEVWSDRRKSTQAPQPGQVIRTSRPASPNSGVQNTTAESSVVSLTSGSGSSANHQTTTPTVTPTLKPSTPTSELSAIAPSSSKRNLFGKMFRKKDSSPATSPASPALPRFPLSASPLQSTKTLTPDPSTTPTARSRGHSRNISNTLSPASLTDKFRQRSSSPNARALGLGLLQVPSLEDPSQQSNGNGNGSIGNRTNSFTDENPSMSLTANQYDEGKNEGRILRPPVLGIQPTLSYSYLPTTGGASEPLPAGGPSKSARALMYVWFVKRWYKRRADDRDTGGLFGMMQHPRASSGRGTGFSNTGTVTHVAAGEGVEVRFEWKRNSAKARARKGRGRQRRKGDEAEAEAEKGKTEKERMKDKVRLSRRLSTISHQSGSTNISTSEEGHGRPRTQDSMHERRGMKNRYDEDEDSDPEDSETPWTCTLKIRRSGSGTTSRRASTIQRTGVEDELGVLPQVPQVLRLKVGTLSPTPHHPKVLGMLKVPFPLPDIEVERMGTVKRSTGKRQKFLALKFLFLWGQVGPTTIFFTSSINCSVGVRVIKVYVRASSSTAVRHMTLLAHPGEPRPQPEWEGLTLTAEEIKDAVCSTAMWLAVRESFGGVGKVNRKGDGWRIRA
ncbi:hypothetical protein C0992_011803 [Termitomyces sp. T32_za158]|nr:hypothetical protein C0992_011803 [Termitomyces sp. T32_za158]